jgi:hypothetical protein
MNAYRVGETYSPLNAAPMISDAEANTRWARPNRDREVSVFRVFVMIVSSSCLLSWVFTGFQFSGRFFELFNFFLFLNFFKFEFLDLKFFFQISTFFTSKQFPDLKIFIFEHF